MTEKEMLLRIEQLEGINRELEIKNTDMLEALKERNSLSANLD